MTADKAPVRKEPLFDAEVLEELSKGQTISTVKTVPSQEKNRNYRWFEIDSKGQKGYVWMGDLAPINTSASSEKTKNTETEKIPPSEEKSSKKVVEATVKLDYDRAIQYQDYSSFAGT